LANKGGKLVQPIQLTITHTGADAPLVVRADHREVERRSLSLGTHTFNIYVDPVETARKMVINYEIAGKSESAEVRVEPARKLLIFILPHSHHDLDIRISRAMLKKSKWQIFQGIELARKHGQLPARCAIRWNLEVLWGADLFMRTKTEPERQELISALKKGWIGLNGMYANELTGLCRLKNFSNYFATQPN